MYAENLTVFVLSLSLTNNLTAFLCTFVCSLQRVRVLPLWTEPAGKWENGRGRGRVPSLAVHEATCWIRTRLIQDSHIQLVVRRATCILMDTK